jgi:hypothetical protein
MICQQLNSGEEHRITVAVNIAAFNAAFEGPYQLELVVLVAVPAIMPLSRDFAAWYPT